MSQPWYQKEHLVKGVIDKMSKPQVFWIARGLQEKTHTYDIARKLNLHPCDVTAVYYALQNNWIDLGDYQ